MSHYCKSFQEFAITLALIKDGVKLTLLWCPIFLLSTFVFFLRCNFYNNLTHTYTNKHTHKVYIYIYIYTFLCLANLAKIFLEGYLVLQFYSLLTNLQGKTLFKIVVVSKEKFVLQCFSWNITLYINSLHFP